MIPPPLPPELEMRDLMPRLSHKSSVAQHGKTAIMVHSMKEEEVEDYVSGTSLDVVPPVEHESSNQVCTGLI